MSVTAATTLDLAGQVLDACRGEDAQAVVYREPSGLARFAGSEVHQPTLIETRSCRSASHATAASARRRRTASPRTPSRRLHAERPTRGQLARRSLLPGLRAARRGPRGRGLRRADSRAPRRRTAAYAAAAIEATESFDAYGFFTSGLTELAVAATTGQAAEQSMTDAVALVLAAGDDASG